MVNVILVDIKDNQVGTKEKIQAHRDADLHRAFSVLLYNSQGEMLIHKRALDKYHCGGLWTNACCSHPYPNEDILDSANRRLFEELGYKNIPLQKKLEYIYKVEFKNSLTEHEYLHVFVGITDKKPPLIDPNEIAEYKWVSLNELKADINRNPLKYTEWFKITLNKIHEESFK